MCSSKCPISNLSPVRIQIPSRIITRESTCRRQISFLVIDYEEFISKCKGDDWNQTNRFSNVGDVSFHVWFHDYARSLHPLHTNGSCFRWIRI